MTDSQPDASSFAAFVREWNAGQYQTTPALHQEMADWLENRWLDGDTKLLMMAFRGSGKSTLVGLFCAWLLSQAPNSRILVLAAELSLARKLVRNTKRVIERHPKCLQMKPARPDQWASEHFTINRETELRDPSMLAKGMESNVTGTRADLIICDDVEVPKTCATEHLRENLRERLRETDYILVPGGTMLFIGTPHSYFSIYAAEARPEADEDVPFLDGYARLSLPLIDDAGKSRWPERFGDSAIADLQRRSGPHKFKSQMLLVPVNASEGRLDPERLRPYDDVLDYRRGNGEARLYLGGRRLISASCFWDPAYGAPNAGDASVVAAVFTDEDGEYWLHGIRYLENQPNERVGVDEATQQCRQVATFMDNLYLPSISVETNGIGRFLPGLLRRVLRERRLQCAVIERHSRQTKSTRILEAFDAVLAAGRLHAHESVMGSALITEMREWRPGATRCRDDGLDAVAGCLLNEPIRIPHRPNDGRHGWPDRKWQRGLDAFKAKADFEI